MKRSTIIKRIRKAGYQGLPLRDLGTQGEALQALYAIVNDGELATYFQATKGENIEALQLRHSPRRGAYHDRPATSPV
jgi:hypothetical protein